MFIEILSVDQDVIEIHRDFPLCNQIDEDCVHERLECRRGVGKPEEHDKRFEQPSITDESCLPLVPISNANVIVARSNVEFGEVFGPFQFVQKFGDEREGISVLSCPFVQISIVLARSELPVLFPYEEEGRCLRRLRGSDVSFS